MSFRLPRPSDVFALVREATRHVLRHPVVGVAAAARTQDGRWLLIRRRDTGGWALPGGTLEWGESLSPAIAQLGSAAEMTPATRSTPSTVWSAGPPLSPWHCPPCPPL